jgi:hypothetical protein
MGINAAHQTVAGYDPQIPVIRGRGAYFQVPDRPCKLDVYAVWLSAWLMMGQPGGASGSAGSRSRVQT